MKKFVIILAVLVIGLFGIQESFAQNGTWYLGEGLKPGYYSYELCHIDYNICSNFKMDFLIEDKIQNGSESFWLALTEVHDRGYVKQGEMHLGKDVAEPIYWSPELELYAKAFKDSVTELAIFSDNINPRNLTVGNIWYESRSSPMETTPIFFEVERLSGITIPSVGHFEAMMMRNNIYPNDKIYVVDDFPFPMFAKPWDDGPPKKYQYWLKDYEENIFDDPFNGYSTFFLESITDKWYDDKNFRQNAKIYKFPVDGNNYYIPYSYSSAIKNIQLSCPTLLIDLEPHEGGEMIIEIPRTVIDPWFTISRHDEYRFDGQFGVTVYGKYIGRFLESLKMQINFEDIKSDEVRTPDSSILRFYLSKDVERVEIYGDFNPASTPNNCNLKDTKSIFYSGMPSPKKQIQNNISLDEITCEYGLQVIVKPSNNSPECVKPSTAEKLLERGWTKVSNSSLIMFYEEKADSQRRECERIFQIEIEQSKKYPPSLALYEMRGVSCLEQLEKWQRLYDEKTGNPQRIDEIYNNPKLIEPLKRYLALGINPYVNQEPFKLDDGKRNIIKIVLDGIFVEYPKSFPDIPVLDIYQKPDTSKTIVKANLTQNEILKLVELEEVSELGFGVLKR